MRSHHHFLEAHATQGRVGGAIAHGGLLGAQAEEQVLPVTGHAIHLSQDLHCSRG